ncbi:PTS system D-glucose-specific IIA component, Glc family [Anaerobranca californiensis DSM 14826]|jgi:PTS system D-glucosamine-specific IIC component|uniref:PTS system D-glucose-specific IIA component, Glc family n=1 Tax=Anaerobranca californiensis DSM 14826 TaxID=1120989 RepID=A0A1M6MU93_9FIRM|nr:PTS glucose transporter subunit IIA [Anaerobranca californiensis]SHJ87085.1 PTS system D-glucose-specific IIA component, Glc family [Anaerobranca californiensis DSM 14826]
MFFFKKDKGEKIYSPIKGEVKPITETPDQVFSQKIMGDGCCFELADGLVVSPIEGEVTTIFETKHAIGLTTKKGTELIIHVGMDTVSLGGEGFTALAKPGDKVKVGDPLLQVDIPKIQAKVPSMVTPLAITNLGDKKLVLEKTGTVERGDHILTIN